MYFSPTLLLFISAIAAVSITGVAALAQNQTTTTTTTPAANATTTATATNMTLENAKDQYLQVWNQTEFSPGFSTFVEQYSALGYGVYKEHSEIFRPGETIVLYVEPVGFGHGELLDDEGNTLYLMNITADYVIAGANGTELQAIEDIPVGSIVSHRLNTELFLELTLTQEQPFPVGDYTVTYVLTDEVSGESFELAKDLTVAETVPGTV
jgi:hypothetical protein